VMQLELYASLYHGRACRQHIRQQGQRGTRDKRQRRLGGQGLVARMERVVRFTFATGDDVQFHDAS
jgi:hypothetical protein